jgi:hypothetical protein
MLAVVLKTHNCFVGLFRRRWINFQTFLFILYKKTENIFLINWFYRHLN